MSSARPVTVIVTAALRSDALASGPSTAGTGSPSGVSSHEWPVSVSRINTGPGSCGGIRLPHRWATGSIVRNTSSTPSAARIGSIIRGAPKARSASRPWMVVSCSWRRVQNPFTRGIFVKFQHGAA